MKVAAPTIWIVAFLNTALSLAGAEDSTPVNLKSAANYPPRPYYTTGLGAEVSAISPPTDDRAVKIKFHAPKSYRVEGNRQSPLNHASDPVLEWQLSDGPVPFYTGQRVTVLTSLSDEVLLVQYCLDAVAAGRRSPEGRWEFIVRAVAEKPLIRVAPTAFDGKFTEVRWTKKHGLMIAEFPGGEYGAGDTDDLEAATPQNQGWLIVNQPNERVLPGRGGWVAFLGKITGPVKGKDTDRWLAEDVLSIQRLR